MTILVVDDEPCALDILALLLTRLGHEVITASDGAEAKKIMLRRQIRMVVSDWYMPKMDGLELFKWIRAQHFVWFTYFILVTGDLDLNSRLRAIAEGVDAFLTKPVEPDELEARVREAVQVLPPMVA